MIKNTHIDGDVSYQRNITAGGNLNIQGSARFGHSVIVEGWLEANNIKGANKGLFGSYDTLFNTYPRPENGWFAGVTATAEEVASSGLSVEEGYSLFVMYIADNEKWEKVTGKFYKIEVDVDAISKLEEGFRQLSIEHDEYDKLLNQHDTAIQSNENRISAIEPVVGQNTTKIDELKVGFTGHIEDYNNLKSLVSEDAERISNNEIEINAIKAKDTVQDNQISTINANIAENTSDIASLKSKVDNNISDISALSSVVGTKANQADVTTALSKKADLNNVTQTISTGVIDVFDKIILDKGEEAYIQYDNGNANNGNSFISISDTQQGTGATIKIRFTGSEENVAYESAVNEKVAPINANVSDVRGRVDVLEQDMSYAISAHDRCDLILESVSVVLASMGPTLDNEGNDSDIALGYRPGVGDKYYDSGSGHIYYQKSATEATDLGIPRSDRVYCNMMTKRLYVYKNGWKKVGEPNDDLSKIKSDIQLNSNSIEAINGLLGSKKDEIQYVGLLTDVFSGTAKNKFIVLGEGVSLSLNLNTLGFTEGEFNEAYFLIGDSNELYISGWDIYSAEDVIIESGYQYLIHIVNHYMTFTKLNTFITNTDGGVAVK